jgi:serine/threonine-protein kinase
VPSEAPRIEVPVDVAVPVLYGTLGDVEAALRAVGLTLGAVTRIESAEAAERMLSQQPSAGERVLPGTVVHVTVASGNNVVPQVGGMTVASATAMLQSAGFAVEADRSSTPSSKVAFSLPAASTVVRVGVTVTLVIDTSTPTPGATTSPSPDSGASS